MNDLGNRLNKMQQTFTKDFVEWANVVMGNTALAMIRSRIRTTGQAADGGSYKPYSKKNLVLHSNMFLNKDQRDTAYKEARWFRTRGGQSKAYLPGGYKRLREIVDLPTRHKDFLYTGEMWGTTRVQKPGTIKVLSTIQTATGYVTTVGSMNELTQTKLQENEKREGKEILAVNKKEEQKLQEILDKWITNRVNQAMNG